LSKVPEKLWTYLMVDFITKLPIVARKDVILVVCNRLSKMAYFVVTKREHWWRDWQGCSEIMCGSYIGCWKV